MVQFELQIYFVVVQLLSCVLLFCKPMDSSPPESSVHGLFRQEHWSGLSYPPPGYLPDPGTEPASPALFAGGFFPLTTREAPCDIHINTILMCFYVLLEFFQLLFYSITVFLDSPIGYFHFEDQWETLIYNKNL